MVGRRDQPRLEKEPIYPGAREHRGMLRRGMRGTVTTVISAGECARTHTHTQKKITLGFCAEVRFYIKSISY